MKTFAMMVLGCKVNDYEATYLRNKMLSEYNEVSFKEKADVYIIFTCCVTNVAEAKTRKMIHHARNLNKDAYVIAIGCLSQIKGDTKDFDDVDLIIGSSEKDKAFELIKGHTCVNNVKDLKDAKFENLFIESYPGKSRAFLKIQDGCNQFCSYCVIPYSRGRERSCDHESVIKQAKVLTKSCKELVLTGIHTGRYNDGSYNLYQLLCELIKIDELETIRLSSIELTEISDEIIELIKNNDKIAHHLHIPVQSCSNEILKAMHRPYTIEEFINRVNYIRNQIPDISISTDLIVGFPNESDELFNETLNNLSIIKFSFIHVFPYSKKAGTVADKLTGHLTNDIKKKRVNDVIELEKQITLKYKKNFINKNVKLLVEKNDNEFSYGYIKQYIYVKVKGLYDIGQIIDITIDDVNEYEVTGYAFK